MIFQVIEKLESKTCKIHIYSLSSSAGIHKVHRLQKKLGPEKKVTFEINPFLMFTNAEQIADGNTLFKSIPPIRDQKEQNLVLKLFKRGYFDIVSSNHFPVKPSLKLNVENNFFKAMPGVTVLGLTLPLLWTIFKH